MNSAFEIEFADGYYGTVYRLLPDGEEELDEGNAFTVPASGFYRFKVELWNSSEDYPASYKLTVKAGENVSPVNESLNAGGIEIGDSDSWYDSSYVGNSTFVAGIPAQGLQGLRRFALDPYVFLDNKNRSQW